MFSIIRTSALTALREEAAQVGPLASEVAGLRTQVETATDSVIRADLVADEQLKELGRVLAETVRLERELREARQQRDQVEAEAREQLDEIREDVARIKAAADDPETGKTVKAGIAYGVLRNLIEDVRAEGLELQRPFDLVAILLGFDTGKPERRTCGVCHEDKPAEGFTRDVCPDCRVRARRGQRDARRSDAAETPPMT